MNDKILNLAKVKDIIENKMPANNLIGMAWVRLYDEVNLSLGIIEKNIPALSIAVEEKYRNNGIGTQLL